MRVPEKVPNIPENNLNLFDTPEYREAFPAKGNFLPTTKSEMKKLGWDSCDVIIVTGDAYVDHASFGMAIIGRLLDAYGYRVGIIDQPDWNSRDSFKILGRPNLFFGVTSGNMDSMVNRYTADRKIRRDDSYSPDGKADMRPDRATIVYSQRCREAYRDVPVVIGGIEASLRRFTHYDYWSDKLRKSILIDSKADLLIYGNGERQIVDIAYRIAKGNSLEGVSGTCFRLVGEENIECIDCSDPESEGKLYLVGSGDCVRLPSYKQLVEDKELYAHATRIAYMQKSCSLVQQNGDHDLLQYPPQLPLTSEELDFIYDLPYLRVPHPKYKNSKIPAYEMIRFSVNILRGCFGGCSFCSITAHSGKAIQSRSEESVIKEIEKIRDTVPGFTGIISDVGGPSANSYKMVARDKQQCELCKRFSCLYPEICSNLNTDHSPLLQLYSKIREIKGIKKVLISSGVRFDLALRSKKYIRELAARHTGGLLKIAPEHTESNVLKLMQKPGLEKFEEFVRLFQQFSKESGKEQYIIPYFIASHPGTDDREMLDLALWLKRKKFRLDQVQNFYPTPATLATAMYYSGLNPLQSYKKRVKVFSAKGERQRRLHKSFLRYHTDDAADKIRQYLLQNNLRHLVGKGKNCLVSYGKHTSTKKEFKIANKRGNRQNRRPK